MHRRLPRGVTAVAQGGLLDLLFAAVPVGLSRRGRRHGWSDRRPGPANLAGALPLLAGTGLLAWAISSHYRAAEQGWKIGLSPDYLLTSGPYRFSRNPMYVGEAAIWAGWAVLLGSLPVAGGLLTLVAIQIGAVRLEERMLHRRWGSAYDAYRKRIPRWIGPHARTGQPRRPGHTSGGMGQ
jgi:protein-S-isoprenylcysteine O-methyltransferase Ste14